MSDEIFKGAAEALMQPDRRMQKCSNCLAWKPKPNQATPIFGGCARSGKTTLHYGDVAYVHYTTDLQSCSAWEPK